MAKVALITGCSSGIGLELVKKFLDMNWIVVATMRSATDRTHLLANLGGNHKDKLFIKSLDVTKEEERANVIHFCNNHFKRLDLLVNNAGFGLFGPFEELDEDQIRYQMEVNFFGAAMLTQLALPMLRESKGQIINVSSAFGFLGFPLSSVYCASKFALEGWSESLHFELEPHEIKVNLIEPGARRTQFSANTLWAAHSKARSELYDLQTQNYKNLFKKLSSRKKGPSPERVANTIVKLVHRPSNPIRMQVGGDAVFSRWFIRFLPQHFYHFAFKNLVNSLFTKPNVKILNESKSHA